MFGSKDRPDDGSTRVTPGADRPYGTTTDADVTSRMTGTAGARHAAVDAPGEHDRGPVDRLRDRDGDGVDDRAERTSTTPRHSATGDTETRTITTTKRRAAHAELEEMGVRPARTSAAATFALVFGLSSLFCGLTGILAPAAVVFGLVGLVLGVVGRRKGRLPGITGRSIATGGLLTSLLGLLLGLAVLVGLGVYVNQQGLDGLQDRIDDARDALPSGQDVVEQVPGS